MKYILNIVFVILSVGSVMAQSTGLSFLKIGVGGRATGMGEAYTAVADNATAAYWNPAGLIRAQGNHLFLTHNEWLQDVRSEFIGLAMPKDQYALGFSLTTTNISGIEIRGNQPSVQPIATFNAHDLALGFSYARRLNRQLDLGVTTKYVYEKIYIHETNGIALDIGLNYKFNAWPVRTAMVLQNIGLMSKLRDQSPDLPHCLKAGVAFFPSNLLIPGKWIVAGDIVSDFGEKWHANLGIEYGFKEFLMLRAGYQSGYEVKNFHIGFGFITDHISLDYGYVPLKQDLGQGHRLSFGVMF